MLSRHNKYFRVWTALSVNNSIVAKGRIIKISHEVKNFGNWLIKLKYTGENIPSPDYVKGLVILRRFPDILMIANQTSNHGVSDLHTISRISLNKKIPLSGDFMQTRFLPITNLEELWKFEVIFF